MSGVVRLLWKKMPKSNKQGETSSFSQWRPHYPVYHSRMLFVMPPPGNTSKTNNHQCLPTKLEQCLLVWIPSTSHSVPPLTPPHPHIRWSLLQFRDCFQDLLGNWRSLLLIQQLFSCLSGCESPHFGLNSEAAINNRECQEVTLLKCRHLVCYHAITSKERRLPKLQALNCSSVL